MTLSEKIANLPLEKQKELLERVRENPQKYRLYSLSPQQTRMWFLYHLDPESTAYVSRFRFVILGDIDQSLLDQTVYQLLLRHSILRSIYFSIDGVPYQSWKDLESFSSTLVDGVEMKEDELDKMTVEKIDLTKEIPLKAWYIKRSEEIWYVISLHHIVHDGWSMGILLDEFYEGLSQLMEKGEVRVPEGPFYDYYDYLGEIKEKEAVLKSQETLEYWKNYFGSELTGLTLKEKENILPAENVYLYPDSLLEQSIHALAKKEHTSSYIVLLSVFLYLLEQYNGKENVNVGMPVLNREGIEQLRTVGYFANTVVFKSSSQENSYSSYLQRLTKQMTTHLDHGSIPFEWIVDELGVPRRLDSTPLFNVMFSMQGKQLMNNRVGEQRDIQGRSFSFAPYFSKYRTTSFYLMLTVIETQEGISMGFSYDPEYFSKEEIEGFKKDYCHLLDCVVQGEDLFKASMGYRISGSFNKALARDKGTYDGTHNQNDLLVKEIETIWEEILGHRSFSQRQPFFSVGGNSINSFQLLKRLQDSYGTTIKMVDLFTYNTIHAMAEFIDSFTSQTTSTQEEKEQVIFMEKF